MTIEIGDKPLSELTPEDLIQIIIIEGCCPVIMSDGEKIWNEPTYTDFSDTMFGDTLVLDYHSHRVSDNMKSSEFVLFFNHVDLTFHFTRDYAINKYTIPSQRLKLDTIKYLIQNGYNIPIY